VQDAGLWHLDGDVLDGVVLDDARLLLERPELLAEGIVAIGAPMPLVSLDAVPVDQHRYTRRILHAAQNLAAVRALEAGLLPGAFPALDVLVPFGRIDRGQRQLLH